mgnify:CR=1 FL=1
MMSLQGIIEIHVSERDILLAVILDWGPGIS